MLKRLFLSILFAAVTTAAFAGYVMNPYTGKMDNIGPMKYNGTSAEVDGSLYVDHNIYVGGVLLTSGGANPTANAVSKSTGSALVDSGIYAVGSNVGIGTTVPTVGLALGVGSPSWTAAMTGTNDAFVKGDVEIDGALYVDGFIYGNGSKLTGISAGTSANTTANSVPRSTGSAFLDSAIYNVGSNVGIGSVTPRATLDVDGSVYTTGAVVIDDTATITGALTAASATFAGTGGAQVGSTSPTWAAVSMASSGDMMVSGDMEIDGKLYVDNSIYVAGNIGIGSSNPAGLLDVKGSTLSRSFVDGGIYFGTNITKASPPQGQLVVQADADSATKPLVNITNAAGNTIYSCYSNAGADAECSWRDNTTTRRIQMAADGVNYITSQSSTGYLGIGTTTPTTGLEIGAAATRTSVVASKDNVLVKGSVETDGNIYVDSGIYISNANGGWLYPRQPDGGCSRCGVDAAGTTWACTNITCGPGM